MTRTAMTARLIPALAALAVACNTITGLDDLSRLPSGSADGSVPGADSGAGVDAATDATTDASLAASCTTPPCAVSVVCGSAHTCALRSDGLVYCWGNNAQGQLGLGPQGLAVEYRPKRLAALEGVEKLWAGPRIGCALGSIGDGGVACWGGAPNGTGGFKVDSPTLIPSLGGDVDHLAAGDQIGCAVRSNGALQCWGNLPGVFNNPLPAAVPGAPAVRQVATSRMLTCVVTRADEVRCFDVDEGSLGAPKGLVTIPLPKPTHLVAGNHFLCSLAEDDKLVRCTFGIKSPSAAAPPSALDIVGATDLAAGETSACARNESGLECFDVSLDAAAPPVRSRIALPAVRSFCVGSGHRCAVLDGGELQCWGDNDKGQVGDGSQIKRDAPVRIDLRD